MLYSGQAFGTKSCIVINAGGAVFSNTGKGDRMSWTEERIERLRQLWGSGRSASEIAEILGDVSRNAIIGQAHRLGLSGRPSPIKAKRERSEEHPSALQSLMRISSAVFCLQKQTIIHI